MRLPSQRAATAGAFALLFLGLLIWGAVEMNNTRMILDRGEPAEATVVAAHESRQRPNDVVVTFLTRTEEHVTAHVSEYVDASELKAGDTIEVVYDPDRPDHVVSAGLRDVNHYFVLIPFGIFIVGALTWDCVRQWNRPA